MAVERGVQKDVIPPSKGEHRVGKAIKQDCTFIYSVREVQMGMLVREATEMAYSSDEWEIIKANPHCKFTSQTNTFFNPC